MGPWAVVLVQALFVLVTLRLIIYFKDRVNFSVSRPTLIVIGSGRHKLFLDNCQVDTQRKCFLSYPHWKILSCPSILHQDTISLQTLTRILFQKFRNLRSPTYYNFSDKSSKLPEALRKYEVHYVPRSREVGQSYITSVWTTLYSIFYSLALVWKISPKLVIANGPGTCLPICFSAYLLRVCHNVSSLSYSAGSRPLWWMLHRFIRELCMRYPPIAYYKYACSFVD